VLSSQERRRTDTCNCDGRYQVEGLCSWGSKHFGIRPTLVLIAMANHAHNDGTGCYPSIATLARKTSLSIRGVQSTVRRLEQTGFLVAMGKSKGGRGLTTEYTLTLDKGVTCLWRIDTVGVKRSDPRTAQQPRTQAPDDLIGSLPEVDRIPEFESLRKITQPLVSDIRIDSEVAIERSGDLRLVVRQADSAFALPSRCGCDGC